MRRETEEVFDALMLKTPDLKGLRNAVRHLPTLARPLLGPWALLAPTWSHFPRQGAGREGTRMWAL